MRVRAGQCHLGRILGLQCGAVNYTVNSIGCQFGAFLNWNTSVSYGWQTSVANVDGDDYFGFSTGVINYAGKFTGLQLGVVNTAYEATGLQLGAVNAVETMHGVQIGAINMVASSALPVMVIVNASF